MFEFIILLGLLAWAAVAISKRYNILQRFSQEVREAHANIMASMKKRVDLLNRLIDTVSNYGDHEKLTYISIAANTANVGTAMAVAQEVNATLNRISMLATSYPDLKADRLYQDLMSQLHHLEADIQGKREKFNASVREYNSFRTQIPQVFFSNALGFPEAKFFDVENADSLENLREFRTDDGALLRAALSNAGSKVVDASRSLGDGVSRIARLPSAANESANNIPSSAPSAEDQLAKPQKLDGSA